ncbi:hypothetical protein M0Q28_03250 [Patescibacteria group bacterium]|jgi:hypothetical protein|nr:hypothetical protein [Patescibacteria group bacterium]
MQKHLFVVLALVSTMGFAMPALAAPSIVSKTELKTPVVNKTILNRFYKLIYPDKAAISSKPFSVSFQEELPCGDTTYRLWVVEKNLKTPFVYAPRQGSAHNVGIVYQAVRNGVSKWATLVGNTGSGIPTFLGCNGNHVIIADHMTGMVEASIQILENPSSWSSVKNAESYQALKQMDDIVQQPGFLYMGNDCIADVCSNKQPWGSSAVLVFKDGKMQKMTPPHYRDLLDPSIDLGNFSGAYLNATFYRLSDGYLVIEVVGRNVLDSAQGIFVESTVQPKINVYRIHDGEMNYSKIVSNATWTEASEQLANQPTIRAQKLDAHGLVIGKSNSFGPYAYNEPVTEKALVHGYTSTESNPVYVSGVRIFNETATKYTVRYQISSKLGGPHYWQAVVQK